MRCFSFYFEFFAKDEITIRILYVCVFLSVRTLICEFDEILYLKYTLKIVFRIQYRSNLSNIISTSHETQICINRPIHLKCIVPGLYF
jgi:hypothetical protein